MQLLLWRFIPLKRTRNYFLSYFFNYRKNFNSSFSKFYFVTPFWHETEKRIFTVFMTYEISGVISIMSKIRNSQDKKNLVPGNGYNCY